MIILQRTVFFQTSSCARAYVCIIYEKIRVKFPWELYWENKAYKLKRSIPSGRFLPMPDDSRDELQRTCKSLARRQKDGTR